MSTVNIKQFFEGGDKVKILLVNSDQDLFDVDKTKICLTDNIGIGLKPYYDWHVVRWFINHSDDMIFDNADIVVYISKED